MFYIFCCICSITSTLLLCYLSWNSTCIRCNLFCYYWI
uniref:Uncharacterized protein n=1 Tax=Anguilla anguilla TaxID=7936 RepID=A0A0E9WAP3_ANGAN